MAGLHMLSQKKKAQFWLSLVEQFPNIIDYVCNPSMDASLLIRGLDEFFQTYVASPEDTEEEEVDDQSVGTILFTAVRPEFRGPVACFLASTSRENRERFRKVTSLVTLPKIGKVSVAQKLEQMYAYFSTAGEDTRIFGFGVEESSLVNSPAGRAKRLSQSFAGLKLSPLSLHQSHARSSGDSCLGLSEPNAPSYSPEDRTGAQLLASIPGFAMHDRGESESDASVTGLSDTTLCTRHGEHALPVRSDRFLQAAINPDALSSSPRTDASIPGFELYYHWVPRSDASVACVSDTERGDPVYEHLSETAEHSHRDMTSDVSPPPRKRPATRVKFGMAPSAAGPWQHI